MNYLKSLVLVCAALLILGSAFSQTTVSLRTDLSDILSRSMPACGLVKKFQPVVRKISGSVTDSAGRPIPFASVMTSVHSGLPADSMGNFELQILNDSKNITVSSVGYQAATIDITDSAAYVVKLTESPTVLPHFEISQSGSRCVLRCGIRCSITRCNKRIIAAPLPAVISIKVFPNPAASGGVVSIQSPEFNIRTMQLFDNAMRAIKFFQVNAGKNAAIQLRLPDHLPAGIYYLVANDTEKRRIHIQKLLVL